MTSKYDRLAASLTASGADRVACSFSDVERVIGGPLPPPRAGTARGGGTTMTSATSNP